MRDIDDRQFDAELTPILTWSLRYYQIRTNTFCGDKNTEIVMGPVFHERLTGVPISKHGPVLSNFMATAVRIDPLIEGYAIQPKVK